MAQGEKVIGVLGGMGPEATLSCYARILRNTRAEKDQDHLRVIIDSNAKVPDRTEAILGKGPSPVPALVQSAVGLAQAGADFIIIPCVSAHAFLDQIQSQCPIPILSMLDVVAEAVAQLTPTVKTVGLLATTGTISSGLFQKRLARGGIATLVPDEAGQKQVMRAIYDIKRLEPARSREAITSDLVSIARTLTLGGAQAMVAGCTEIPLALSQSNLTTPYVDSLLALAHAAIRYAGGRLSESSSLPPFIQRRST